LSSMACPSLQYFPTLSHKLHDLRKKKSCSTQNAFWFPLQGLSEILLILKRTQLGMIKMSSGLKYPFFLSHFNETWIFSTVFRKMLKHQISWKSVQWEPAIPCGQTDMTKLIVAFRYFLKVSKKATVSATPRKPTDPHNAEAVCWGYSRIFKFH